MMMPQRYCNVIVIVLVLDQSVLIVRSCQNMLIQKLTHNSFHVSFYHTSYSSVCPIGRFSTGIRSNGWIPYRLTPKASMEMQVQVRPVAPSQNNKKSIELNNKRDGKRNGKGNY